MKRLKTLLPGLVCLLALCVLLPLRAEAAAYTGSCGTNAVWKLDTATGVLTVSGTGAMNDYTYSTRFWKDYSSYVKKIVVEEGITRIGNSAFNSCAATSVSLPSTLKTIGDLAFYQCKATVLNIPAGITAIGDNALDSMANLTAVNVAEGNPSYSSHDGVLYKGTTLLLCPQNTALTAYTVKDGTEEIAPSAFFDCVNLTSLTLPAELETIGSGAFYYCENLSSVTVSRLLPTTLANNGQTVFYGCAADLTLRAYDVGNYMVNNPYVKDTWQAYANKWDHRYQSLGYAGGKLKNGTWLLDGKGVLTVTAEGAVTEDPWDYYYHRVEKAVFGEGITEFPAFSGYSYSNMTAVSLPSTLTAIPDYAFYKCTALKEVTVPAGVTSLGEKCFYYCYKLTKVTLPEGITAIPDYAFYDCRKLTSVNIPATVTAVGDYAFWACGSLTQVALPAGLERVGDQGFSNCTGLTAVTLPAALTDVGEAAFVCCTGLRAFTVAEGNPAFAADDGVLYTKDGKTLVCYPDGREGTAYALPETVAEIAPYALYYSQNLTSLTLPAGIQTIGVSAANGADALTDVYYGGSPEQWQKVAVDSYAFDKRVVIHYTPDCVNVGHGWSGWQTVTAPTWLTAGAESRACSACGETETNVLPATGQTAADGVALTVTDGVLAADHVPVGMTVLLAAYENGRLTAVGQGSLALPEGTDGVTAFFLADGWRPVAAARPLAP